MRIVLVSSALVLSILSSVLLAQSDETSRRSVLLDWWLTPEQQAKRAWENGDNDSLQEVAPSREWKGAAAYRQGDFEAALEAFTTDGDESLSLNTLYNQATTNIQLGDYANALAQLEEVLAEEPENANATRNRDIALRLLELEQQQQQDQQGEGGEGEPNDDEQSSEEGEQSDPGSSSESDQSSDSKSEESESSNEQNNEQQDQSGASSEAESEDTAEESAGSEDEREAEIEAAREALQAAGEESENETEQSQSEAVAAALSEEPMSEEDQATEQWLRQIPDDPDDLLRRKLLQNHRNEYPGVQRNGSGY